MPGQMHPPDAPRTDDPAERLVWQALAAQLPDTWQAWHSLKLRTAQGQFGEGDFVVADPERGYLVVEVKGGAVTLSKGRWFYASGRPIDPPPLDQAHAYARKLQRELERVWTADTPRWGVGCCLPETPADNRPTNSHLRDLIIDATELGDIVSALRRLFTATVTAGNAPRDPGWIDALTQLWGDAWEPRIGLLGRARLRDQKKDVLNEQQVQAVRGLAKQKRVIVSGGAGTGKSTVAMRMAEERAWAGQSVRYVCFTLPLARWVDEQLALPRDQAQVDARAQTIHAFALELAQGWSLDVPDDPHTGDEWNAVLQAVAEQPSDRALDRPDLLIVDEGQSFSDEDWNLVDRLRTPDASFWIFRDPAQAFWSERAVPERFTSTMIDYELQHQERMPKPLEALARAYAGGSLDAVLAVHDPDLLRVVPCHDDPRPQLIAELDRLLALGFRPGQLAVVTMVGQSASRFFTDTTLGPHQVVHADDPDAPDAIVVETFLRFQGLDRAVLILCEGHLDAAKWRYDARMHMALTRATTGVVVLAADGLWERDRVLAAMREAGVLGPDVLGHPAGGPGTII